MDKQVHWVMDYETIVNAFVAVFRHYKDPTIRKVFVISDLMKDNQTRAFIEFLQENKNKKQWHISYNGLQFDSQISHFVLDNSSTLMDLQATEMAFKLYQVAQQTIECSKRGEFLPYAPFSMKIKQLDVFKLNHWDNRAKNSSLKWIQYSMDWKDVREMPHPHNVPVTTLEQLQEIIAYCHNDVDSTANIMSLSIDQIKLRQSLTKLYGIDLINASEPRISKELFLHFLNQKTGIEKSEIKTMRTHRQYIMLAECILPYIQFKTEKFQKLLDYFRTKVITSTKDGFKYSIEYNGVKTDYGLGGIHGSKEPGIYEAGPGYVIVTSDVKSFYPNLAIRNKFHPEHIPQKEFVELYEWFYDERIKIPKSNPLNYVFKIILNSTYGLSGDENSFLYDPKFTMQITINGQLSLSMLYEMICEEIPEAVPLMQNTDGLETLIPVHRVAQYMDICKRWEELTQLELEHDQYQKMIIRDVNNYIAIFTEREAKADPKENLTAEQVWNKLKKNKAYTFREDNGRFLYTPVKCKGAFEWADLDSKAVATLHKNKSHLVIPKAIHAYFVNGIKPEDYLASNTNIVDYCAGVKAKSDWYFESRKIENGSYVSEKLQKIIRYYISKDGVKIVKCHKDGREIQEESGEWLQTIFNTIPDIPVPFETYEINTKYYLEKIYKEIDQIESSTGRHYTQLKLF